MKQIAQKSLPVVAVCVALLVAVQFVRLLEPAQAREVRAACNGLAPAPTNPAFRCPTKQDPDALCQFPTVAKDFTVQDHTGAEVSLSDYRGQVVLVNFWASWCNVCKSEKPGLEAMQNEFGDEDFAVLALASDSSWTAVKGALPEGTPLKVLLDPPAREDDNLGVVARAWGLKAVPESFLVDRNGVIRHYFINKRTWNGGVAQTCVRALLDE